MDLRTEVPLTIEAILDKISRAETYYKSLETLIFVKKGEDVKVKLKKDNTTQSFVRKFFDKFNEEYHTMYSKSKNLYCTFSTRRSIGDIFRSAHCYLGDKIKLADIIVETYNRVLARNICANYCYQINKRVYKERGPNKNGQYYDANQSDELGFKKAHYDLLLDYYSKK